MKLKTQAPTPSSKIPTAINKIPCVAGSSANTSTPRDTKIGAAVLAIEFSVIITDTNSIVRAYGRK
jgi:hypothetical protein